MRLAEKKDEEWPVKEEVPKRMEWTRGTEVSGYLTQKEPNAKVKEEAEPPTSDQAEDSLPFASHVSFNAHVLLSNEYEEDVKNNCPVDGCSENFDSLAGLEAHMKKHPRPVVCGICKRPFPYPSDLRQHYLMHTGEKRFACGFCCKRFADHSTLRRHIQSHTGERCIKRGNTDFGENPKVDTPVVKEEVEDGEEWRYGGRTTREAPDSGQNPEPKRRKWTHGAEASGDVTQKKQPAGVKREVDSFSAVDGRGEPSASDQTDDSLPFAKLESFNAHVLLSNEDNVKKEEMEEEERQIDAGEKKNCLFDGCLKSFLSFTDLVDHLKIHPVPLICRFCKKSFRYPSNLRQHYTTHTGEKNFACTFCDKRFTHSSNLKTHLRTHPGLRPGMCDICGFETSSLVKLKKHQQMHTEEKRYSCTICGFQTAYPETLTIHKKICNF